MKVYNKLIRDKIPGIIEESGKRCEIRLLDDKEYLKSLNQKLEEELKEYYESGYVEELADIAEVIYAIALHKGVSMDEFEKIRLEKREKRGGFEKKLFLVKVLNDGEEKWDFESVWRDIVEIINKNDVITTLAKMEPITVAGIVEDGLVIINNDKPEHVNKEWIETTWYALVENGKITAGDIPGQGSYRSSFIMALLAKLEYVDFELAPITLYLRRD